MEAVSRILPVTALAAAVPDLASFLAPGQAVQARVQQILGDGLYRLTTPRGPLDVASPTPLPLGQAVSLTLTKVAGETTLRIAVHGAGHEPTPAPASASAAARAPAPPPAVVVTLGASSTPTPTGPAGPSAQGAPATAALPPAVPREAGVPTALASTIAPRGAPELAATPAGAAAPARPGQAAPSASGPLFATIASALTRQDGLAPLVASLAALAARPRSEAPPAARTAIDRLAALRLDTAQGVAPEALASALERSGIFFETRLARGEAPDARGDLKALLLALREGLAAALPADAAEEGAPLPRAERPAPPMRGEPPAAQKPMPPAVLPDGPNEIARLLLNQTEASLARMRLAQVASLPSDAAVGEGVRAEPAAPALHATVPLGLGRETALLDLVIERDAQQRSPGAAPAPLWRVWLALDVEPAGPVTALVTLGGAERSVAVTIWAEREATERALAAAMPGLRSALTAADLAVGETATRAGRPRRITRSGRFLDTTT